MTKSGGIYFWRVGQVGGSFYVTRVGKMRARTVAHRAADVALTIGFCLMAFGTGWSAAWATSVLFQ